MTSHYLPYDVTTDADSGDADDAAGEEVVRGEHPLRGDRGRHDGLLQQPDEDRRVGSGSGGSDPRSADQPR